MRGFRTWKVNKGNTFVQRLNVESSDVSGDPQHGIIELWSNIELKAQHSLPLLRFYILCVRLEDFHWAQKYQTRLKCYCSQSNPGSTNLALSAKATADGLKSLRSFLKGCCRMELKFKQVFCVLRSKCNEKWLNFQHKIECLSLNPILKQHYVTLYFPQN